MLSCTTLLAYCGILVLLAAVVGDDMLSCQTTSKAVKLCCRAVATPHSWAVTSSNKFHITQGNLIHFYCKPLAFSNA